MTRDPETLAEILKYMLVIAAIFATAFPVIYSFSRWHETGLGRILMLHGISLAFALDVTVLFYFWTPTDILVAFWIEVIIFTLIALASCLMCIYLVRLNYMNKEKVTDESS